MVRRGKGAGKSEICFGAVRVAHRGRGEVGRRCI